MTSMVKGQGRKVTSSAWQVLVHKSRTKRSRNTKIDRTVVHPSGNKAHQIHCQRSKAKATTSTNAEIRSTSYRPNGKAYKLQTWYIYGVRRPVSPTSAMTSKVKGQGRDRCWSISRERKVPETLKLVGRLLILRAILRTSFRVKRSKVKVIRETESVSCMSTVCTVVWIINAH